MSEVMHNTQREFWRPPAPQQSAADAACERCGTEFMVGARFCHVCGTARQGQAAITSARNWTRYLEFHNIQQGLGLSTASLIAFLIGALCILLDRKSTRLNSSHANISYAVFCLKKKKKNHN